jgi:hypothetical protein
VYKGKDLVTGTTMPSTHSHRQTTPLPPILHLFSTNPQEHPRRRTKKDEHDDQAAGEEQGCDELKHKICFQPNPLLCFLLLPQAFSEEQPSLLLCLFL